MFLLGLMLPRYGARVGRHNFCSDWYCLVMEQSRVDVIVWRAHLDIDLYGGGSRDRTAWETSFRPHSLAEISVAEPGSFELHYLVSRWYSRCCCQPGNYRPLILGFLRRSFNNSLIFYQSALIFVDSWKLSFLILGFLRQRLQLRDILLSDNAQKNADRVRTIVLLLSSPLVSRFFTYHR